jgi:hypothetical protein
VPVVVRLGVLTMFPMIEALSAVAGPHFETLCDSTMNILQQVLSTLKPCALASEPQDCLLAFHNFVLGRIRAANFDLSQPRVQVAARTLLLLAVASGDAGQAMTTAEVLLRTQRSNGPSATINAAPLAQLLTFEATAQRPLLLPQSFVGGWVADALQPFSLSSSASAPSCPAAVATDGECLYVHVPTQGLLKFGTGDSARFSRSVRGHVYASNPSFRVDDKSATLAFAGGYLFYFAVQVAAKAGGPSLTGSALSGAGGDAGSSGWGSTLPVTASSLDLLMAPPASATTIAATPGMCPVAVP